MSRALLFKRMILTSYENTKTLSDASQASFTQSNCCWLSDDGILPITPWYLLSDITIPPPFHGGGGRRRSRLTEGAVRVWSFWFLLGAIDPWSIA